jgi:hypothetical protein
MWSTGDHFSPPPVSPIQLKQNKADKIMKMYGDLFQATLEDEEDEEGALGGGV